MTFICRGQLFSKLITQSNRYAAPKHYMNPACNQRFLMIKQTRALKTEKQKIQTYIAGHLIDYMKYFTKVLENRFPKTVNIYRVFTIGIRDLLADMKKYTSLKMKLNKDQGFSNMSSQEIEFFEKMPHDMYKLAPVLILSIIPFSNYIIFPLVYMRPKTLLSSHFWSIQQRSEFAMQELRERLTNNKPVFRALQSKVDMIPDKTLKRKWESVMAQLGSGLHPKASELVMCKELFSTGPYQLDALSNAHTGHLLRMHGLRKGIFRKYNLKYRAMILAEIDKAIIREGGVETLNMESLRNACILRGLNSTHLSNDEMRQWLTQWLTVSRNIDKTTFSLLLHCPIFFAYNHPQNWMLLY